LPTEDELMYYTYGQRYGVNNAFWSRFIEQMAEHYQKLNGLAEGQGHIFLDDPAQAMLLRYGEDLSPADAFRVQEIEEDLLQSPKWNTGKKRRV
jgi:non-ribosomal peptide synthetase component E (peptide arylation enzyme)